MDVFRSNYDCYPYNEFFSSKLWFWVAKNWGPEFMKNKLFENKYKNQVSVRCSHKYNIYSWLVFLNMAQVFNFLVEFCKITFVFFQMGLECSNEWLAVFLCKPICDCPLNRFNLVYRFLFLRFQRKLLRFQQILHEHRFISEHFLVCLALKERWIGNLGFPWYLYVLNLRKTFRNPLSVVILWEKQ